MSIPTYPYDTADYLDTDESIAIFAEEALADLEPELLPQLIRVLIRAHGLNALSGSTGLPRRALVEALSGEDPNGTATLKAALVATGRLVNAQAAE